MKFIHCGVKILAPFFIKQKTKKQFLFFIYIKKTEIDILNRMILITSMLTIYLHDYIMISFMFSNEVVKISKVEFTNFLKLVRQRYYLKLNLQRLSSFLKLSQLRLGSGTLFEPMDFGLKGGLLISLNDYYYFYKY